MANVQLKDGAGATKYTKATGAGSDVDPFIIEHKETSATAIAASVASVDTKTPALGQALAAASTPVVLPAAQITTLTPPAAITGFATEATLDARTGALTETAPATDTASSGLNGRLQRIAQRLTSLIALVPASLGQKAKTASFAVTLASDEDLLATQGAVADAAVSAGATGSVSAKLRAISRDLVANIVLAAGTNTIGNTKDAGPSWTTVFGVSGARYTSADRSGSAASVTDAPTSGQKICVDDIVVGVDTAMRVDFKEETSGTVVLTLYMAANSSAQITLRGKLKLATADKKLQVQTSVAGNIAVLASYHSEA